MTINIDLQSMRQAIADVVVEYGADTIYDLPNCVYQHSGEASCLIGKALFKMGVPVEVLGILDNVEDDGSISSHRVRVTLEENNIFLDSDAADYAEAAQNMQDSREPWGAALEGAEAWISRNG